MTWLEEKFGFSILNVLPDRFLGIVKKIALACMSSGGIQPVSVLYMSKLLEQCFAYLKQNVNGVDMKDNEWIDYAMRRASTAGFIANGDYKSLRNTKPSRVRRAIGGKDVTLQANFLAWLCTENEGDLKNIAKKCNYLVEHINKVSELRGHDGIPEEGIFKAAKPNLLLERTVNFIIKLASSDYFYNSK